MNLRIVFGEVKDDLKVVLTSHGVYCVYVSDPTEINF